jgi:hypothetical protein
LPFLQPQEMISCGCTETPATGYSFSLQGPSLQQPRASTHTHTHTHTHKSVSRKKEEKPTNPRY